MAADFTCAKQSQPDSVSAPENIILGNGSNEVIEFLGHAFLNLDDDVITSEYAFIVYKLIASSFGARTIETPSPGLSAGPRCDAGCNNAENPAYFYPQS